MYVCIDCKCHVCVIAGTKKSVNMRVCVCVGVVFMMYVRMYRQGILYVCHGQSGEIGEHVYIHVFMCTYAYVYMYMCVCVCVHSHA